MLAESKLDSWTNTGLDCLEINANCDICPIHNSEVGLHKKADGFKKCHQAEANARLLALGLPIPNRKAPEANHDADFVKRKKITIWGRDHEKRMAEVRTEMVRWMALQDEPTTMPQVLVHLNALEDGKGYMGRSWKKDDVQNHFAKMVLRGVLKSHNPTDGKKTRFYSVLDASKLDSMVRKEFRAKKED